MYLCVTRICVCACVQSEVLQRFKASDLHLTMLLPVEFRSHSALSAVVESKVNIHACTHKQNVVHAGNKKVRIHKAVPT